MKVKLKKLFVGVMLLMTTFGVKETAKAVRFPMLDFDYSKKTEEYFAQITDQVGVAGGVQAVRTQTPKIDWSDPEQVREYHRQYHLDIQKPVSEQQWAHRKYDKTVDWKNPKQVREYHRQYEQEHKEEIKERFEKYYEELGKRAQSFDLNTSPSYQFFKSKGIATKEHGISIARVLEGITQCKLTRDTTRRKELLYAWYDEHWEVFKPVLETRIVFEFEN